MRSEVADVTHVLVSVGPTLVHISAVCPIPLIRIMVTPSHGGCLSPLTSPRALTQDQAINSA